jgi:hypothetical protein
MKPEEKVVETYLKSQIDLQVIHEPYKKQTPNLPDFELKGTIGIEVRRLNHNLTNKNGDLVGLESVSVSLKEMIISVFDSFDSINGDGWYVNVNFQRNNGLHPLKKKKLVSTLKEFESNPIDNHTIQINEFVTLRFKKRTTLSEKLFYLNQPRDRDRNGWFLSNLISNLPLVITEKEDKVRPVIERYNEWWLVLVDYICGSFNFDDYEKETILKHIPKSEVFNKIIIIEKSLTKDPFIIE